MVKLIMRRLGKRCIQHWVLLWCGVLLTMWLVRIGPALMPTGSDTLPNDTPLLLDTHHKLEKLDISLHKNQTQPTPTIQPPPAVRPVKCVRRPARVVPQVHDVWYAYYAPPTHREVYVYSAYMDDRPDNKQPLVRLLVVSSTIKNTTYCQLWYEGEEEPVVAELRITKNGRGHRISKVHYEQYYFSCPVTRPHPVLVSVTSQPCETPQSLIPVTYPSRGVEHEFGVCVPVTFGSVDPHRLAEWVEAHLMFGVTEISVYYVHMSHETLAPFRYYDNLGVIKLYNIPTVPHWEKSYDGNKLSSMVSLNDCMYRNMYRYKWLIDIDFDEIIVPNKLLNYPDLIREVNNNLTKNQVGVRSFTFRNSYFWVGCGAKFDKPSKSVLLTHVRREPVNRYMYAPKTILSPLTCVSLFNHYCYHVLPTHGKPFTIDVNPSFGFSHHYRRIRSKEKNCPYLKDHGVEDLSLHRFKGKLEKRYLAVVKDMKL